MNRLGIECLGTFGLPPAEHVRLAAQLGCGHVSLNPGGAANPLPPHSGAPWSENTQTQRALIAALRETGVSVSLIEGFAVLPGSDVEAHVALLDLAASLGARAICAVSLDKDMERTHAQFARLAELADARAMIATTEVGAGTVRDLGRAQDAVRAVGHPGFRLLVDTMHFFRKGASLADFAALDPAVIGHVQLCDVPVPAQMDSYLEEALFERRAPGDGDLPLRELLRLVPEGVPMGLEVPIRSQAESGVSHCERLGRCVAQARALMA